jgi:NhaP-type Na+/H+ or K+/H+ antiporter
MVRSIGAQLGLLAFSLAILAGLYAGNSPTTILLRALLVLLMGAVLGQTVGWGAKLILRDHLQRRKLATDRDHRNAVRTLRDQQESAESPAPADGG